MHGFAFLLLGLLEWKLVQALSPPWGLWCFSLCIKPYQDCSFQYPVGALGALIPSVGISQLLMVQSY